MENKIKDLMSDSKHDEALRLLLQTEKNYLLKVQCLYELNKYEQLNSFFEEVVDKIEEDYFEILGFYVLSLIETKRFDTALNILNEELSMPYIEMDYQEIINSLYDDVVAQKQIYLIEEGVYETNLKEEDVAKILESEEDYTELLNTIMKLDDFNIRKLLSSIAIFLKNDNSPILKTFILEVLIRQQINEDFEVIKNNDLIMFTPVASDLVISDLNYIKTVQLLEDHLAKQPSYLSMALDVLMSYAYILYPHLIEEEQINLVAATIEYYILSLNYEDIDGEFEEYYHVSEDAIESSTQKLIEILKDEERFSYGEY
ncbi:MAG: hypothetical protein RR543_05240 [Erysipelotrichales bacterium]